MTETTPRASADFDAVYDQHFARLVTALRWAGADDRDAEDLAQEAFVRTLVRWRTVRDPAGYAFRTGFRLLTRSRRTVGRRVLGERRRPDGPPADEALLRRSEVDAALSQLTNRQRECVVLHHYLDQPTDEVARTLGIRASTVRVHLHDARQLLTTAVAGSEVIGAGPAALGGRATPRTPAG